MMDKANPEGKAPVGSRRQMPVRQAGNFHTCQAQEKVQDLAVRLQNAGQVSFSPFPAE